MVVVMGVVGAPSDLLLERSDPVEHKMLMAVDQTRHQRHVTEVHGRRLGHVRSDGFDPTPDDRDPSRFDELVTVEQPLCFEDGSRRIR